MAAAVPQRREDWAPRRLLPRLPAGIWSLSGFTFLWFFGIVVPLIGIVLFSFLQTKGIKVQWDFTIKSYERLFFYGGGPLLERTIRIAATMTAVELLLAFPFALWLAKSAKNAKNVKEEKNREGPEI